MRLVVVLGVRGGGGDGVWGVEVDKLVEFVVN